MHSCFGGVRDAQGLSRRDEAQRNLEQPGPQGNPRQVSHLPDNLKQKGRVTSQKTWHNLQHTLKRKTRHRHMTDKTDQPRKTLSLKKSGNSPDGSSATPARAVAGKRIIRRDPSPSGQPGKPKPQKNKRKTAAPRKPVTPPSLIRANELDQRLTITYEVWKDHQPLAIGIEKNLFQFIAEHHLSASKRVVQKLLHRHTSDRQYLHNLIQQPLRFYLDGSPDGEIILAEKEHATRKLAALPPT